MSWAIGVDVGGTFTDFFALNEQTGELRLSKRPSTPDNPAAAIVLGLEELSRQHGLPLADVRRLSHGTTVATNALIQRQGKAVAMVTTRGFRDLIEIGRQVRPHLYDLQVDSPEPVVPRERRFEVDERVNAAGQVHRPLSDDDVAEVIEAVRGTSAAAVAVCFLFSFLNPGHERAVAARLQQALPGVHISVSSAVQPEFREYERFTTTVINAYLQPIFDAYIGTLESSLSRLLPGAALGINQSNGGLMTLSRARAFPVRTVLSGPAAGVVGAIHVARAANRPNVITVDVGGTSADVALVRDYHADVAYGREVDGLPIRLPMVDINTVGAGGGSIAWLDRDQLLKVGPESAGAEPGPACYGRGGTRPTVSDANLLLGRLSPHLIGGSIRLDAGLAERAVGHIACAIGKTIIETAHGIVSIAVSNMVRAIRTLSVERGHDPRQFVLMPFGGAGPLHARDIAVALGIREILVPPAPGIICAQGLVVSDLKEDFVISARTRLEGGAEAILREHAMALHSKAENWVTEEELGAAERYFELKLDMRYVGQNFELSVPVSRDPGCALAELPDLATLRQRFFEAHEANYGFHNPMAPIEIINFRLIACVRMRRAPSPDFGSARADAVGPHEHRRVYFAPEMVPDVPVYRRGSLAPGQGLKGPAIIEQLDTTTPLFPRDVAYLDAFGNLLIKVDHAIR